MPEEFQKIFIINMPVRVRQKANGVYEARFRAFGYNICVSSSEYDMLKPKFILALREYAEDKRQRAEKIIAAQAKSPRFCDVANRWLELRRATIKASTYDFYSQLFGASIFPYFSGRELCSIKQSEVQELINSYSAQGKFRTAVKIYQTLNAVFEFAVGEDIIERSPMRLMRPPKYEEKTGVALTVEEERELISRLKESNCDNDTKGGLLFLLYTGIRRSELASARIEGDFVSVVCAKTRKGFRERRRLVPITPMLARWLPGIELSRLNALRPNALTQAFKRLMPAHHLHELRHTFITRCQECGVPREVVSVWAGHAADNTQTSNVYTHFSAEYMKKEGQKVIYNL